MKKPKKTMVVVEEKDYTIHILLFLVVAGTFLRFYQLGFNSLWLDEISTYNYAKGTFGEIWAFMANGVDYSPPLYFFLQHFMVQIFGASEWGLRFLSALFGVLTIPVMYLVGKEFKDKYAGYIAAGIVAFSPFLVFYSQEARSYAVTLFFVSLMVLFYLKALKSDDLKDWIIFGVCAAASFWSHYYAAVVIVAMGIHLLIERKDNLKSLLKGAMVGWGVFVALIIPLLIALVPVYAQRTASSPTYGMRGMEIVYYSFVQILGYADVAAIIYLSLFSIGCVWLSSRYHGGRSGLVLILLMIGVTFLVSIIMSYRIPMMPRYLIFLIIPFSLGIAMALEIFRNLLPDKVTRLQIVSGFLVLFILLGIPFFSNYYSKYTKEDWKGISKDVASVTSAGDTVVAVPIYIELPLGFYYDEIKDQTTFKGTSDTNGLDTIKPAQNKSIYYIVTSDIAAADPSGMSEAWLYRNTKVVRNYGSVYLVKGVTAA